jgi:hypothetical protein
VSGHENNSAGGDGFYSKETVSRHPQTIFVETPDPFPKCWRGNTGILECDELCKKNISKKCASERGMGKERVGLRKHEAKPQSPAPAQAGA